MEINKKHLDIMAYLRSKEDYVPIGELAEQYGLSPRGIRYNLDKIEQYMVSRGLPYLDRERSRGVRLVPDQKVYDFVDGCAGQLRSFQYSYSAEERQTFLRLSLLMTLSPLRIEDLCHSLDRSRNTLFKDMEKTEEWLDENNILLIKKPRVGLYCEGDEFHRRQLITHLMLDSVDSLSLVRYATEGAELRSRGELLVARQLMPAPMAQKVAKSVKRLETLLKRPFSDDSFAELMVQLAVVLHRGGCGFPLNLQDPNASYIPITSEYAVAHLILDELEERSSHLLPEDEVRYFTYCLLGAKVLHPSEPEDPKVEDQPLLEVTRKMINDIARIYNVDFGDQYDEIERGIFLHLKPAAHRLRFGLYNRNPLYNEIVSNYNALFINTRIVCHHLEEYLGCPMNDHEVSYITLHFGAALHRVNLRTNTKARVLLVCGTGLGSAQMITAQVNKFFNVDVVGTVSGREAMTMDKTDIDYIITTVPLPEEPGVNYIQVSPMFNERDREKVAAHLSLRFTPKDRYDMEVSIVNRLMSIIEKNCVVPDRLHLQYELLNELMNSHKPAAISVSSDGELSLCDLLTRDHINIVDCPDNWQAAIRSSAALLEKEEVITPHYKEAIIQSLEEFGPYMVMLPGVALSHAVPDEGVNSLGMSLSLLKTPVHFGYKAHDPVRVVVTLAAKDEKTHLKALAQLFRMFKDSSGMKAVLSGDIDEILHQIREFSK